MFARSWNEDMEKLVLEFYEDRRYIFSNWQASVADAESLTDAAPVGCRTSRRSERIHQTSRGELELGKF